VKPSSTASGERGEALATELRERGVVVLPEALPTELVGRLKEAFLALLTAYIERSDPNRGVRRHQMYLPFEPPFSDPALWADPTVLDVVERVLGPDFECTYYGSDTPYPGSEHQPVHQDGGPIFPEWDVRPPMYSVALNVPLVDVDEHNGPLEWFLHRSRRSDLAPRHPGVASGFTQCGRRPTTHAGPAVHPELVPVPSRSARPDEERLRVIARARAAPVPGCRHHPEAAGGR
jgi:hypothetical protein